MRVCICLMLLLNHITVTSFCSSCWIFRRMLQQVHNNTIDKYSHLIIISIAACLATDLLSITDGVNFLVEVFWCFNKM